MTPEILSAIAGVVISLAFFYIPGLNSWYAALPGDRKRLVMLGALLIAALGVYLLACSPYAGQFNIPITCDDSGWIALLKAFVAAAIANQTTFLIAPARKE